MSIPNEFLGNKRFLCFSGNNWYRYLVDDLLETEFPGRHFTLDGHLVGSIGEVMAAYYYGIELYKASTEKHDGVINDREVQIKITQQDDIVICAEPDYLIIMPHLPDRNSQVFVKVS
ncbi:MAG: hypothetical protein IKN79_01325 [Eubacterium sp.]|nr:hypothetical protein [Eubacterium sp.]